MTTPLPPPQPRGIDYSLPTCGETQCSGRGRCVGAPGGGSAMVCDCVLGYRGAQCQDTVNEAVSLPLTLGVVAFIVGVLILAFIVAKIRQRYKRKRRSEIARLKQGYNVVL